MLASWIRRGFTELRFRRGNSVLKDIATAADAATSCYVAPAKIAAHFTFARDRVDTWACFAAVRSPPTCKTFACVARWVIFPTTCTVRYFGTANDTTRIIAVSIVGAHWPCWHFWNRLFACVIASQVVTFITIAALMVLNAIILCLQLTIIAKAAKENGYVACSILGCDVFAIHKIVARFVHSYVDGTGNILVAFCQQLA
jgi:hypothetical protein